VKHPRLLLTLAFVAWGLGAGVLGGAQAQAQAQPQPQPQPSQTATPSQADSYQPRWGQAGKDVMWLPSRDDLLLRMLESARITPEDVVVDLGAGDGKIAIAAARLYGARAVGIEYNPSLAALAQRQAQQAGVADRVRIIAGDLFQENFSEATVVTLYLLEELNLRLRPTLLAMKPGTRVVSNTFSMGDWDPDEVISVKGHTAYRWVVPAAVAGHWSLTGLSARGPSKLTVSQRFQRVGGQLEVDGRIQTLLGAELQGAQLSFRYVDAEGFLKVVRLQVDGERMSGEILGPYGMVEVPVPNATVLGQRLKH